MDYAVKMQAGRPQCRSQPARRRPIYSEPIAAYPLGCGTGWAFLSSSSKWKGAYMRPFLGGATTSKRAPANQARPPRRNKTAPDPRRKGHGPKKEPTATRRLAKAPGVLGCRRPQWLLTSPDPAPRVIFTLGPLFRAVASTRNGRQAGSLSGGSMSRISFALISLVDGWLSQTKRNHAESPLGPGCGSTCPRIVSRYYIWIPTIPPPLGPSFFLRRPHHPRGWRRPCRYARRRP